MDVSTPPTHGVDGMQYVRPVLDTRPRKPPQLVATEEGQLGGAGGGHAVPSVQGKQLKQDVALPVHVVKQRQALTQTHAHSLTRTVSCTHTQTYTRTHRHMDV